MITTAMMAVVLVVVGGFIYVGLKAQLTQTIDAGLRSRAEQFLDAPPKDADLQTSGTIIDPDEAFAQVLTSNGEIINASPGVDTSALLTPAQAGTVVDHPASFEVPIYTGEEFVPARLLAVPDDNGQLVVVGASLEDQHDALKRLAVLSVVGGVVALALSALVGWLVAGAALRPVERMRSEAEVLSSAGPGRRLAVPKTGDELARLGETLNDMLEQLEVTMERERRFVSDASHELRTPLANLKAELELALRRPRDEAGLRLAIRSAAEETDRLIQLAQDLLVLARADKGELTVYPQRTDLSSLLVREASTFEARAAERDITIEVDCPAGLTVEVDAQRMRQAIGNLLDNAIRHSPSSGEIEVSARAANGSVKISVADLGEGFAEDLVPHAFERFSRGDAGRSRSAGGVGLGLAVVHAVIQAHGGTVEISAHSPGGLVTLTVRAATS